VKTLLVILFAISTVVQPGVVLCVETSGDAHIAYVTEACCDAAAVPTPARGPGVGDDECRRCNDLALATDAFSRRTVDVSTPIASISTPCVFVAFEPRVHHFGSTPDLLTHSSYTPHLSSTVIRR